MGGQTTALPSLLSSQPPSAPPASASPAAQPLSVSDFAAKIRAKNPGAYDDLTDQDLTTKVLAKYPQYSDMVSAADLKQQALSRTFMNMTRALAGQKMDNPEDQAQAEKGKAAGFKAAALTAATGGLEGAVAPLTAARVTGTTTVGTGILDAAGNEITREVARMGPSAARAALSNPIVQKVLWHAVSSAATGIGIGGTYALLKKLGVLGE